MSSLNSLGIHPLKKALSNLTKIYERNILMLTGIKISLSHLVVLCTIAILASVDLGCSSSRLTNEWRDPEFKNTPMTNMLIVAAKKTPVNRRIWEDEMVAELSAQGVTATPSYRLYTDSIPDPDQVATSVRENKFDGVLFIRKIPTELTAYYVPGPVKNEQFTRYNEHTQTYFSFYRDVQQSGTTDTSRVVRHEISVFTTQQEGGRLVWAGTGEMLDPTSREDVTLEVSGLIVPELVRQGIIPGK
jgi:hypothetical protein